METKEMETEMEMETGNGRYSRARYSSTDCERQAGYTLPQKN